MSSDGVSLGRGGRRVDLHATDASALPGAIRIAQEELDLLEETRPDASELSRINEAAAAGPVVAAVSAGLADHLAAAMRTARLTDGLVDLTGGTASLDVPSSRFASREPWRALTLVERSRILRVPMGCHLNLSATSGAHTVGRIADRLAHLPGGFLIELDGDVAVVGSAPDGDWRVSVADAAGHQLQTLSPHGSAVATTRPTASRWSQVTVVSRTVLRARAASIAGTALCDDAPTWLAARGISARLDRLDGPTVFVGGWPYGR